MSIVNVPFNLPIERLMGITTDPNGSVVLIGYDELVKIDPRDPLNFDYLSGDPYIYAEENGVFERLREARKIRQISGTRLGTWMIRYTFNPTEEELLVILQMNEVEQILSLPIISGDWFDLIYIEGSKIFVLSEPCAVRIYRDTFLSA